MNGARFFSVFRKSLLEQLRSPWEWIMVLSTGPLFVLLYWMFLGGGSTSYTLLIDNQDVGPHGALLMEQIGTLAYPGGQPILKVNSIKTGQEGEQQLRDRKASALLIIPGDFSMRIEAAKIKDPLLDGAEESPVVLVGDLTNPTYSVASILALSVLEEYLREAAGQPRPVAVLETPLGGSATRTEFETYVPGLLSVAVVMMIFTAAMRITHELERGGFKRLTLTRITPFEYLSGVSTVQALVGLSSVLATFGTAVLLGFRSHGPLWLAVVIGLLSALSVIGVGLMVSSVARSTTEAFIIANFPMILLMFFSGGVFPIPRNPLFDLIPQTHAVLALNKVLTLGAGVGEVLPELSALIGLSVVYFGLGVLVFGKKVMHR